MSGASSEPVLVVRSWRVGWGDGGGLGPLDLDVSAGECVALVGPSGSGKTTLLRSWARLIEPLEGTLHLDGRTAEDHGWPAYRRRIQLLAQRPSLGLSTVGTCLERPFHFASCTAPFDPAEAVALAERLGLRGDILERQVSTLSEGEQQRVALARALLLRPRCLLLDEPTSALDKESVGLVESTLERHRDKTGQAVVWITHDPSQASRVSSRVLDLGGLS